METTTIIWGLAGLFGLYLLVSLVLKPVKLIVKLILYLTIGAVLLSLVNFFSGGLGIHIPMNLFTLVTAGLLQVPGVILLVLMQYMML